MRNITFCNDQIYHVFNRGVDKRSIFTSDIDYYRLISLLNQKQITKTKERLVEIQSYCLMDNHFHLSVRQVADNGISKFMHKVGLSYTRYFNEKMDRKGRLFETTFKAKEVDRDSYLFHIFRYIHLNPLKYFVPDWKKNGVKNISAALEFLKIYKWSSYKQLFTNKYKEDLVVNDKIIRDEFGTLEKYNSFLADWMRFGIPSDLAPRT